MSQLIVKVCKIDEVKPHLKSDNLELAIVGGWQVVVKKVENYKAGDLTIFIPPNSLVPQELSDKYGFTQYLKSGGRVKATNLRSEPSHGVLIPNYGNWPEDTELSETLGIKKWTPEVRGLGGSGGGRWSDSLPDHPLLPKYTEIENMRHYPKIIADGEEVVATEKIHGTCTRVGMIREIHQSYSTMVAGSKNHRRKPPVKEIAVPWYTRLFNWVLRKPAPTEFDEAACLTNWFWFPVTVPGVKAALNDLGHRCNSLVIYGEVYGLNVQKGVSYGSADKLAYRAFDILIDGKYVGYDEFVAICEKYDIPRAPLIFRGPYSLAQIKQIAEGDTTIGTDKHIREGVVVRPVVERRDPKVGRVILKYVSDAYLTGKGLKTGEEISDYEEE